MKEKVMNAMQAFSKAMFAPVLILPIAGLLIAIGNIFTNANLLKIVPFLNNPLTKGFGTILSGSLVTVLTNLGIIFAVGIAFGLAKKKKAEAAFVTLLAYLVFINAMNKFMGLLGTLVDAKSLTGTGQALVLGVQVLDMGVFLGIILGVVIALIHNRFIDTEFNNAFQIYGGPRFVFIVTIPVTIVLAIVCTYVWPVFQSGIDALGYFINQSGQFGVFLYGALERLLIPTGLHHLVYTPFLYTKLGGTAEVAGQVFEGARNIYYAQMADPSVAQLSSSVVWDARGISKMFGLMGACLAMYHCAKPAQKSKVKAILIPAAFTAFIAGVTEPIEFSFLFVAPALFVVHAVLSGLGMVAFSLLGVHAIAPNGFIDFVLLNLPLGIEKTGWPMVFVIGFVQMALYYLVFRWAITKFNFKTLGREDDEASMKLHTKADYKAKKAERAAHKNTDGASGAAVSAVSSDASANGLDEVPADIIVEALGGADNIVSVDNCYTRLRLVLKDVSRVDEKTLQDKTGAMGVVIKDQNVQVIYGLTITKVRKAVDAYLGLTDTEE